MNHDLEAAAQAVEDRWLEYLRLSCNPDADPVDATTAVLDAARLHWNARRAAREQGLVPCLLRRESIAALKAALASESTWDAGAACDLLAADLAAILAAPGGGR